MLNAIFVLLFVISLDCERKNHARSHGLNSLDNKIYQIFFSMEQLGYRASRLKNENYGCKKISVSRCLFNDSFFKFFSFLRFWCTDGRKWFIDFSGNFLQKFTPFNWQLVGGNQTCIDRGTSVWYQWKTYQKQLLVFSDYHDHDAGFPWSFSTESFSKSATLFFQALTVKMKLLVTEKSEFDDRGNQNLMAVTRFFRSKDLVTRLRIWVLNRILPW